MSFSVICCQASCVSDDHTSLRWYPTGVTKIVYQYIQLPSTCRVFYYRDGADKNKQRGLTVAFLCSASSLAGSKLPTDSARDGAREDADVTVISADVWDMFDSEKFESFFSTMALCDGKVSWLASEAPTPPSLPLLSKLPFGRISGGFDGSDILCVSPFLWRPSCSEAALICRGCNDHIAPRCSRVRRDAMVTGKMEFVLDMGDFQQRCALFGCVIAHYGSPTK